MLAFCCLLKCLLNPRGHVLEPTENCKGRFVQMISRASPMFRFVPKNSGVWVTLEEMAKSRFPNYINALAFDECEVRLVTERRCYTALPSFC